MATDTATLGGEEFLRCTGPDTLTVNMKTHPRQNFRRFLTIIGHCFAILGPIKCNIEIYIEIQFLVVKI